MTEAAPTTAIDLSRAPSPDASLLSPDIAARLARLALLARRMPEAERRGRRRTRRVGTGVEAIDTRPYALGDDPRRVAWSAYARLEKLLVRVVADEAPVRLAVVIDTSASMAFGAPTKLRQACRIAAGLAAVALSGEDRVAMLAFSDARGAAMRAVSGRKGLAKLLASLETLSPSGKTDLGAAVASVSAVAGGRALALVLSDFLDPNGVTPALRALAARGHELALVEVLDPFEIDPPDLAGAELEDEETNEIIELPSGDVRAAYRAALAAHRARIDDVARELAAPVLRVTTEEPFDSIVGKALSTGFVRGGTTS
jgi:uncharacterized protein (DUF58 family)